MRWNAETLDQLEAERARLIEDLIAIEAVLRREGRLSETSDETGTSEQPIEGGNGGNGRPGGGEIRRGLRAAIRRVLAAHHPVGMFPRDVTAILTDEGFQASGSTDLATRIAGEMARMRRRHVLRKLRSGRYRLRATTEPEQAVGL